MEKQLPAMQIVPERVIKESAKDMSKEEKNNSFIYALESGRIFKENNLSPIYVIDNINMAIYVTSKERMKKKFH